MQLKHPFDYVTTTMRDEFHSINPGDEMLCLWGVRYIKTDEKPIRSNLLKVVTHRTSSPSSYSDESIDDLCKFFAWLSPSIVMPSVVKQNQVTTMSPRDFLEDAVTNYTPLMAVLFGLATSNARREKDKILQTSNHQDSQSQYLAIAMAHDLILRSNLRFPCRGQLVLNSLLEMERLSNANRDLLTAFRILPSRTFTDSNMRNNVVSKMIDGLKLDAWGMLLLNFDNIGFQINGINAGYSSYTLFQEIHVTKDRLIHLNIYNEDDPTQQLSRKREHNWVQLCDDDKELYPDQQRLATSIVENTSEDFDALTSCICYGIMHARRLVIEGLLEPGKCIPNPAYIIDEDTYNEVTTKAAAVGGGSSASIVASDAQDDYDDDEYRPDEGNDANSRVETRELPITNLDADEVDLPASMVNKSRGNMYGDHINLMSIKQDLSKTETVAAIMDFAWRARMKLLSDSRNEDSDLIPAAEIGTFLMCDGQPATQGIKMVAQDNRNFYFNDNTRVPHINYDEDDSEEDGLQAHVDELDDYHPSEDTTVKSKFHDKMFVSFGVFHATLKMHNCRGLMFVSMLDKFFSAFRKTPGRRKFVIFPHDPRQLEDELPQITCAHYASAFTYCLEAGREAGTYAEGEYPSVKEVHEYMLSLAKKYPFLKAVLNEIRYAEITKMMKMAAKIGKRGSVELWLTTVRFALTLWATTHATEYVRLGCELLRCWYCFSPAERQLYRNEVFTRLTSTGRPEAADQNMEKSVNHVRSYLGKVNRPGMEIKMEGACHKITEGAVGGQIKSDLRGQPQPTGDDGGNSRRRAKWVNPKTPLLKAFDMIHNEMTLWDSKNGPTLSCDSSGNRTHVKEGSIHIPMSKDGGKIVLRTNDCYRIGQTRVKEYFHVFNVETPYRVDRPEKTSDGGVDLGRLLATTTDREDELQRLRTRGTSVDEDDVSDVFTVKELEAEIDKLVILLNGEPYRMGVEKAPTKALKPQKVKKLVELRSIYFGQDEDTKARIEADVNNTPKVISMRPMGLMIWMVLGGHSPRLY